MWARLCFLGCIHWALGQNAPNPNSPPKPDLIKVSLLNRAPMPLLAD